MNAVIERRSGIERRERTLRAYWRGALRPRRRNGRRASDQIYPIIDWYSPHLLVPVLGILGLSALDAAFTIVLIRHGATEVNPLMALFLPDEPLWFAAIKLLLTGLGLLVLVALSKTQVFRRFRGEWLVYAILLAYLLLIGHELKLLEAVHAPELEI